MITIKDDHFLSDRVLQAVAFAAGAWPVRNGDLWILDARTLQSVSLWEAEMIGDLGYGLVYKLSPEMAGAMEAGLEPEAVLRALSRLFGGSYVTTLWKDPGQVERTLVRILQRRREEEHEDKHRLFG